MRQLFLHGTWSCSRFDCLLVADLSALVDFCGIYFVAIQEG